MRYLRYLFSIFVLVVTVQVSSAQQNPAVHRWQFHSINNIGLLEGQTGSSFQLQTVNGVQHGSWFGGVGLGLDFYRYRTIPLFIDIRKEFGKTSNKLFAYADLGINFSWLTDSEKMFYMANDKFHNGFYGDAGLGYKLAMGKNQALLISLGYSIKKLSETYNSQIYYYPEQPPGGQMEKINYSLNRLSIKVGWEF